MDQEARKYVKPKAARELPVGVNKKLTYIKKELGFNRRQFISGLKKKTTASLDEETGKIVINRIKKYHTVVTAMLTKRLKRYKNYSKNLQTNVNTNIKFLIEVDCYRGKRHKNFRSVRGQRTKTNCKTLKRIGFKIKTKKYNKKLKNVAGEIKKHNINKMNKGQHGNKK